MLSVSLRRLLVVLTLAALLCLPSVALAAGSNRHVQAEPGMFARIWGFLQGLWGEEGMTIDPNSSHAVAAPGSTSQLTHLSGAEGVLIDPNGSPTSSTSTSNQPSNDTGMMIDPDGSH